MPGNKITGTFLNGTVGVIDIAKKKQKTIHKQVEELFSMSRSFGEKKSKMKDQGRMDSAITGIKTYTEYHDACMRFADDLTERRGTKKFQICSIKKEEVHNFLERIKLIRRPETVHQYAAALQKLENMTNQHFGKVSWYIDEVEKPKRVRNDVTIQRGPAYTKDEADILISGLRKADPRMGDAVEFIRATGCRAETIFNRTNGKVIKAVTAERIDLQKGTVTLIEKGGKVRTVKYDRQYQYLMERLVNENPRGFIFSGVNQNTMYKRIKTAASDAGFQGRGLHGMRKTFAVYRHADYTNRIDELVRKRDWGALAKEFPVSEQKAKELCRKPYEKTIDNLARLKLTRDLGHNRIEVSFRYVSKNK